MNKQEIKKYLEGKTTAEESAQIRDWLTDEVNESEARKILGEIWSNSEIGLKGQKPNFEQMLRQIHQELYEQKNKDMSTVKTENTIHRIYRIFARVAAILIIPLFLLTIYFYRGSTPRNTEISSVSMREIYTKPGTRTKIELADGTAVWLNDGTTLRYPESFTGSKREVFVDGEAYFEVKHNPEKPFVVNNPMITTVVTGTHFNLNAYSADQYFEATLLEGKISLEKKNQELTMKPGEQVQFDVKNQKIEQKIVNPEDAAAWVNGKLIFRDERLSTVLKKLGRWYNVEIIPTDPHLGDYVLSGTIEKEKLDQTLSLISLAVPVKFEFKTDIKSTEIQRIIYMKKK